MALLAKLSTQAVGYQRSLATGIGIRTHRLQVTISEARNSLTAQKLHKEDTRLGFAKLVARLCTNSWFSEPIQFTTHSPTTNWLQLQPASWCDFVAPATPSQAVIAKPGCHCQARLSYRQALPAGHLVWTVAYALSASWA